MQCYRRCQEKLLFLSMILGICGTMNNLCYLVLIISGPIMNISLAGETDHGAELSIL